jgi:predicted glycosyltransferase
LDVIAKDFGDKYEVPTRPIDGRRLLASTDAFVGMGGTMNAEASLMGVPTVSAFQGSLRTEDYLESVGLVARTQDPDAIVRLCKRFLEANYKERFATRAKRVLGSMEDPVPKIALKLMDVAETAVKRSS